MLLILWIQATSYNKGCKIWIEVLKLWLASPCPCLLQEQQGLRPLSPPWQAAQEPSLTLPISTLQPHSLCQASSLHCVSSKQMAMLTQPTIGVWAQVARTLIQLSAVPRAAGCARRQCQERLPLTECTSLSGGSQESCCSSTSQPYAGSQRGIGSWQSHPAPNLFLGAPLFSYIQRHWSSLWRGYSNHASWSQVALDPRQKAKRGKLSQIFVSASSKAGHSSSGTQRFLVFILNWCPSDTVTGTDS